MADAFYVMYSTIGAKATKDGTDTAHSIFLPKEVSSDDREDAVILLTAHHAARQP